MSIRESSLKSKRLRVVRRLRFIGLLLGFSWGGSAVLAQTNLYFNNTIPGVRNWGGTSGGNGFWASSPTGGTFRQVTTLTDVVNFNTDASNSGAHDVFTGAGQAAYGMVFGVGPNSNGPFRIRASFNTNSARDFTLGAGGITVNANVQGVSFSNTDITTGTLTGELNTLLQANQTWTNHSSSALNFSARLVGNSSTTLTKAGTGTLILGNNNSNATISGITGFNGRLQINQGTVVANHNNALGNRDVLTTALSSSAIGPLTSDTVIASGATLDTNNRVLGNEFISVSGAGVDGNGAIVNSNNASVVTNTLGQVRLLGDTTLGGTGYWDISPLGGARGKLFQDGYTLTKRGSNSIGLTNTDIVGGGNIDILQGRMTMFFQTNMEGPGTVTVGSSGSLFFQDYTGSFSKNIVVNGGSTVGGAIISSGSSTSNIDSSLTFNSGGSPIGIDVRDTSISPGRRGTLNLRGPLNVSGNIEKTGSGVLGMTSIVSASNTRISVRSGGIELNNTTPMNATIDYFLSQSRPSLGGEGQTTGGVIVEDTSNFSVYFDPTTTGPSEHLRVGFISIGKGSSVVKVVPTTSIVSGTGIVVLESSLANLNASQFSYDGRGVLSSDGSKLLLDYQAGQLVWKDSVSLGTGLWDAQTTQNWTNSGTANPDVFYTGDRVSFDDTVGGTLASVRPVGTVSPSSMNISNSTVNYAFSPNLSSDRIDLSNGTLTKSGTGTAVINTVPGGASHVFSNVEVQNGVLELGVTGLGTIVRSSVGSTTIHNGGTFRNSLNVPDAGFGETPVQIDAGGTFELTRGAVPNGTNTIPATIALRSVFSGAGDLKLSGVQEAGFSNSFGDYSVAANNTQFSGSWNLNNSRLRVDNLQGDELGSAKVKVPNGSQVYLTAPATAPYENNVFEIAGTGWAFQPAADGASGAIRFIANGATISASSSIVLTDNARLTTTGGVVGRINAPISGGFGVEYGNPTATTNGTFIIDAANSYTGSTSIENHVVMANQDRVFSTGDVAINGGGGARNTRLAIGNGVSLSNNITVSTLAGQNGRGAIEGGTATQVAEKGAGIGTVSGTINLLGEMPLDRGHFGSGEGVGSILRVTGPINISDPSVNAVSHRSSAVGGYTQFDGGGGNYEIFDLKGGNVRLGADNGLNRGSELVTRTIASDASLDMNGFDQDFSWISANSPAAGSSFRIFNSSPLPSELLLSGNFDSVIQDLPWQSGNGPVNIVKNGNGILTIAGLGNGSGVQNPGRYTINAGTLTAGDNLAGSVELNNATLAVGHRIAGDSLVTNGILSPGNSIGTMTFGGNLDIRGNNTLAWETPLFIPASGAITTDQIVVEGTLDLSNLTGFLVNPAANRIVFENPFGNYSWNLIDSQFPITGFEASDFSINTTPFNGTLEAPVPGTFTFSLGDNGTAVVLNYNGIAIPEPSTLLLVGVSLLFLPSRRRQRKTKTVQFELEL